MISTNEDPLVSIIVPTLNVEEYIAATLNSLIDQTYRRIEIIVVDDGSTDRTMEQLTSLKNTDSRITIYRNRNRPGVSGARNTGIREASGDWIAFLDGDDLLETSSIQNRLESAKRNPTTPFLSGDFYRFYKTPSDSFNLESIFNPYWKQLFHQGRDEFGDILIVEPITKFLIRRLTWTGAAFIRRDLMNHLGGFNEEFLQAEDDHLWLRAAAASETFIFSSTSTSYYRQRPGSLTTRKLSPDEYTVPMFKNLRQDPAFRNHLPALKKNLVETIHKNTYYYRMNKMRRMAFKSSLEGIAVDPFGRFAWKNLLGVTLSK